MRMLRVSSEIRTDTDVLPDLNLPQGCVVQRGEPVQVPLVDVSTDQ